MTLVKIANKIELVINICKPSRTLFATARGLIATTELRARYGLNGPYPQPIITPIAPDWLYERFSKLNEMFYPHLLSPAAAESG